MYPDYLMYGMTYDQYWHGDPKLVIYYREAHRLRMKEQNEILWLQGQYIHEAFAVVLSNAFANKGTPPKRYAKKPYPLYQSEQERQAEEDEELMETVAQLTAWEKSFNAQHGTPDPE